MDTDGMNAHFYVINSLHKALLMTKPRSYKVIVEGDDHPKHFLI